MEYSLVWLACVKNYLNCMYATIVFVMNQW